MIAAVDNECKIGDQEMDQYLTKQHAALPEWMNNAYDNFDGSGR
jgi:hypothetical protein